MNKKTFLVLALAALFMAPISAKTTKEYQRPSLHLVLLTSEADAAADKTTQICDPEILGYVADSWTNYEFPALYNNFAVPFDRTDVGTVKGSIMDLLAMYSTPESFEGMGIAELKNLVEMLQGKKYREDLKKEVDKISNEVAHQLVKKWWCISDDGYVSDTLLMKLACYSATQNQINNAAETVEGAQLGLYNELGNTTIANTFIDFTKVDFYESEPVAAFVRNIMYLVASQTPSPGDVAVKLAADATYKAMKEGYTAFTNNLLYKLEWNEDIAKQFYTLWIDTNRIDMEKFNNMKFNLTYVGNTKASATCLMKKADRGQGAQNLVNKTIAKALNRQFADMQRKFEEFRPMVPVMLVDEKGIITADMGTKEGVEVGDKFNLLEPYTNEKGVTKYKYVATVKVVKGKGDQFVNGVWDNENLNQAEAADTNQTDVEIVGTLLGKFKNANPSMFVKLTK